MRVEVSTFVAAPPELVSGLYRDHAGWPKLFPLIRSVRLVSERDGTTIVDVNHVEGTVRNSLRSPSPEVLELREWKRRYDATFVNRFEAVPGGTRFTVVGDIAPNGAARLIGPLLGGYARRSSGAGKSSRSGRPPNGSHGPDDARHRACVPPAPRRAVAGN